VFGQFQFKRLPFGLATSPGAFQHSMNTVLSGLNWVHCMVYIDDVLIFARDFETHLTYLDDILKRLQEANLKVKLSKCEFVRTECHYLGHKLNSLGMMPDPKKVEAIATLEPPQSIKEVETFVGKVVYYGRFIDHMSTIAKPLFDLKKKNAVWKFADEEMIAFERLRDALVTAPVLRHPDFEKEFLLQTDASGYGLGAVLAQEFEDGEHPIAYASRTLQDAETRYAVIEREGLALQWGINHFQAYLLGAPFKVFTDHKPLLSLMLKDQCNKRLQNYALKLQHFQFTILYRRGSENVSADFLSRINRYPVNEIVSKRVKSTQADQNDEGEWIEKKTPVKVTKKKQLRVKRVGTPGIMLLEHDYVPINPDIAVQRWNLLRHFQRIDPLYGACIRYLNQGDLPDDNPEFAAKVTTSCLNMLIDDDQILRYVHRDKTLICVPDELQELALQSSHDVVQSGHLGIAKTYRRVLSQYWWPKVATDTAYYVKNCPRCLAHKPPPRHPKEPLGNRDVPDRVWERVHLDVWSPGGASDSGKLYVIAFVDAFSKFVVAEATENHTAATVVDTFLNRVETAFGMPEELVSDGAPEFRSLLFSQIFQAAGVTRKIVTRYRPQANGQVERFFRTLRPMLATLCHGRPRDWDKVLPHAIFAYNTSYNAVIQNTPFFLMYGRDPIVRVHDNIQPVDDDENLPPARLRRLALARNWAKAFMIRHQEHNKELYDRAAKNCEIVQGSVVLAAIPQPTGPVKKLSPKYVGPFRVTQRINAIVYLVPVALPNLPERPLHVDRVRLCDANRFVEMNPDDLNRVWGDPHFIDPNIEQEAHDDNSRSEDLNEEPFEPVDV
jgi:transposase InsO family protein